MRARGRRAARWLADNAWWLPHVIGAVAAVVLWTVIYVGIGTGVTRWLRDGGPVDPVLDAKLNVLCKVAFLVLAVVAISVMLRRSNARQDP